MKFLTYGVYGFWDNLKDKMIYVGKDKYIERNKRYKDHYSPNRKEDQVINRIIQNTPSRYDYFILKENLKDNAEATHWERTLIGLFETESEHNYTSGGDGGDYWKGKTFSDEHRYNLSEAHTGMPLSNGHKQNISTSMTSTGIYRVNKQPSKTSKQGFNWQYRWYENGKRKSLYSTSLSKLEQKVWDRGLEWIIIDKELAKQTYGGMIQLVRNL